MKTILIAIDGSAGARAAIDEGLEFANDTGAEALFVAIRRPASPVFGDLYWQQSLSNELARLRPALQEAVAEAESRGIHADYDLLEGDPAERILDLARSRDVDPDRDRIARAWGGCLSDPGQRVEARPPRRGSTASRRERACGGSGQDVTEQAARGLTEDEAARRLREREPRRRPVRLRVARPGGGGRLQSGRASVERAIRAKASSTTSSAHVRRKRHCG